MESIAFYQQLNKCDLTNFAMSTFNQLEIMTESFLIFRIFWKFTVKTVTYSKDCSEGKFNKLFIFIK